MLVLFMHFLGIIRVHEYLGMLMYHTRDQPATSLHLYLVFRHDWPLTACLPFSINFDLVVSKRDNIAIDTGKYLNSNCWMPLAYALQINHDKPNLSILISIYSIYITATHI